MMNLVLAAQSAQGSGMSMIIMMVAIFAIMWFFMIRPQQKRQKEIQKFQNELTEGQQVIFAIMWFFMIRPQQKRQKEIQKFQNELTEGQQVVTGGGIYGTVKSIDLTKNTVDVKIARDVVITVDKNYVFKDVTSTPMQK